MISLRNHGLITVLTFTYILSILPKSNVFRAVILLPIVLYTMIVLDKLHPKAEIFRFSRCDLVIASISAIPYLGLIYFSRDLYAIVPIILLATSLYFFKKKMNMWGNVLGTAFTSSLVTIYSVFALNPYFYLISAYWILYTFTQALYVEYKIPFRKIGKMPEMTSWIVSLAVLIAISIVALRFPLTLLALIEPSIRFFNPGNKLSSPKEIKKLGWHGMKMDLLFIIIVVLGLTVNMFLL